MPMKLIRQKWNAVPQRLGCCGLGLFGRVEGFGFAGFASLPPLRNDVRDHGLTKDEHRRHEGINYEANEDRAAARDPHTGRKCADAHSRRKKTKEHPQPRSPYPEDHLHHGKWSYCGGI